MSNEPWHEPRVVIWSRWLLNSYQRWTGRELIARHADDKDEARNLFGAPFVVVSHGIGPDPVLNYGNYTALRLWEMTWDRLITTPSRLTAEAINRPERERMLEAARTRGYFDGYRGVRITATGRRFFVEQALIWTVQNVDGDAVGQAATFSRWTWLDEEQRSR